MKEKVFSDRVALITGASSGIGKAIALDLLANGACIVLNARGQTALQEILNEQTQNDKKRIAIVSGDACEQDTISKMFAASIEKFQKEPDIVIVNAGRGLAGSLVNADLKQFEELLNTNLLGAAKLMQYSAKSFLKQSESSNSPKVWDMLVLGSISGRHISPFSSVYGGTKFAIGSMTEALRRELAPKGIRVTLIEPAIVATNFQKVAEYDEAWVKNFAERFGRLLSPEDIARTVNFILSQPADVHINNLIIRPTKQDYP